jgi:hypothetical protein
MEDYNIANIAGIEEDDGTVICRDCMDEDAWDNLSDKKIISMSDVEKGQRIYYCDYCEKHL